MDQQTFQNLTGITVPDDRWSPVYASAVAELESLLGWPIDPSSWDNQYLEIGKREDSCPDVTNDSEPDPPDEVVGAYRMYDWNPDEPYLGIDPAHTVHAVKLVKDGITYKTYDADEMRVHWENGSQPWTRYIQVKRPSDRLCGCLAYKGMFQVAVDADWAFAPIVDGSMPEVDTFPTALQNILVTLISEGLDPDSDIKSESRGTHSFTKFDKQASRARWIDVIRLYSGPKGRVRG